MSETIKFRKYADYDSSANLYELNRLVKEIIRKPIETTYGQKYGKIISRPFEYQYMSKGCDVLNFELPNGGLNLIISYMAETFGFELRNPEFFITILGPIEHCDENSDLVMRILSAIESEKEWFLF